MLPGLVYPILFCKEHLIPSCAANSYFACLLKKEQRKCLCVCNEIHRAQCCHSFDVRLNSSKSWGSFEGLTENHWKRNLCGGKKNEKQKWSIEILHQRRGRKERELWTSCLSVFFCVFVWGDEWEFPVPPPCYLSRESGQTRCTGWRKVEFVDFERGKKKKSYLAFELSQQQHTQQPHLSGVCMGIRI